MAYLLETEPLTKYFGATAVFGPIRLALAPGEKAGLVGANGAGKTTLLNCLAGREPLDEGQIRLTPGTAIGYLEQALVLPPATTLLAAVLAVFADIFAARERLTELEKAMSAAAEADLAGIMREYGDRQEEYQRSGGFDCETKARRVLTGLGFAESQFQRPFASFSGGEKTRIGLARILAREYDLLFLDEPTNHLDLASVAWLETYLAAYRGALLIISHDRFFLDRVAGTIFDLEDGRLTRYPGNYTRYAELKAAERKSQWRAYEKQQKEIQDTEAYIRRFKAGIKSKQARGRQTRLDRLERLEKPTQLQSMRMGAAAAGDGSGEKVLVLERLAFDYPGKPLFAGLSAEIRRGERVALLGPNGSGKSTILKLIMGRLKPRLGGVYLGARVKPAYFDQEHQNLNQERTVLEEILSDYQLTLEEAKSHLARFLFGPEAWEQKISRLSGGEQGRLSLLKLTLEKGNFLLLDEPTNHLDIYSREVMEDYLLAYPGTILMVSHDRYFLDRLAGRILALTPTGVVSYLGGYSHYQARKEQEGGQTPAAGGGSGEKGGDGGRAGAAPALVGSGNAGGAGGSGRGDGGGNGGERGGAGNDSGGKNGGRPALDRYAKARLRQKIQTLEKEISELENQEKAIVAALSDPEIYQPKLYRRPDGAGGIAPGTAADAAGAGAVASAATNAGAGAVADASAAVGAAANAGATPQDLRRRLQDIQLRLPAAYREWEEAGGQLEGGEDSG
ncbi:MAG: ATP-binding cassette domain-containing protein [Peptococcaceae bacterium]|jgi:ATP-binding cassette subfamily F protein 3|nr:ATP-binding cassette domain-containing protein [Peptococcaceae bacterium]